MCPWVDYLRWKTQIRFKEVRGAICNPYAFIPDLPSCLLKGARCRMRGHACSL